MIIRTRVKLKGDDEPQEHYALVFDDADEIYVFMSYRNALTTAAKTLATECGDICNNEIFYLIQLAEFISSSLDVELYWNKQGENG